QAIETRFRDAGWRLNVTPEDIADFATGQVALAWMQLPDAPRKPFALAMLVDVEDDPAANRRLLQQLDEELSQRKPGKATLQHSEVTNATYITPACAVQLMAETSFTALAA